MTAWTPERIELLKRLHANGVRYKRAAAKLECSKSAVAGAVRRYVYGILDPRTVSSGNERKRRAKVPVRVPRSPIRWTEQNLTEPYAVRKARRAMEAGGGAS